MRQNQRTRVLIMVIVAAMGVGGSLIFSQKPEACEAIVNIRLADTDMTNSKVAYNEKIYQNRFTAGQTLNIYVYLIIQPREDLSVVHLEFSTPDGQLYESKDVVVSFDKSSVREVTLPGYRFPLRSKQAVPVPGEKGASELVMVTVPLAIGGTYISSHNLYGMWVVRAYLHGNDSPCRLKAFFIVE